MRPPLVISTTKQLIYHPIRKAASSSIQHALGTFFATPYEAEAFPSYKRFTVWRPPHERLLSLYIGSVNPAASGFYHPWEQIGIEEGMPFSDFIDCVAAARNDAHLDMHFHTADWPSIIPNLICYHFNDLAKVAEALQLKLPHIGPSYASQWPTATPRDLERIQVRYSYEYATYPALIESPSI